MLNFIISHQLNMMMVLSGICGFIFLFLLSMRMEDKEKKASFMQIAFFALLLLIFDRYSYIFEGDTSRFGYWMVRISNFMVYATILLSENGFNNYMLFLSKSENIGVKETAPLKVGRLLVALGLITLIISQFTGLYYTFDENNVYSRGNGFIICYLYPLLIIAIQLVFIIKHRSFFRKKVCISLIAFAMFPVIAAIIQVFNYGVALTSISIALSAIVLYFLALFDVNNVLLEASYNELNRAKELKEKSNELLNQTVEALVSAVDAKDKYTHGHSERVAYYSKRIAKISGMSEAECEDVYLAGLLHDVGKIGIDDEIINKTGKLTKEEFDIIKQHPGTGEQILSKIVASPMLSIGAHYHHERYDGKGYPEGLKGEDIPQIARIIAVADAYDAMTSKRSYRNQLPQQQVREELFKGIGTQFDPRYAKIMIHMVDIDEEYRMKELHEDILEGGISCVFAEYKAEISAGLRITDRLVRIKLKYQSFKDSCVPSLLFYDSADAVYYNEECTLKEEMEFTDYAAISLDGKIETDYVRTAKQTTNLIKEKSDSMDIEHVADISLVKQEDHLLVHIVTDERDDEVIVALHDASRYVYLALTGEHCRLDILDAEVANKPVEADYVPRIIEKISYIDGPQGDIPNVQVDAWRTDHSEAIELKDNLEVTFKALSLPASRRVWHCPIVCLFTSDDGKINGKNYKEYALVRLDGEVWSDEKDVVNTPKVIMGENFGSWKAWSDKNREGADCKLSLHREMDRIILEVENSGLKIENKILLPENAGKLYIFFTGDQCAITDIHISRQ